jgi:glycine/D-amino acid oxidase-like deaminating enzyme
MGSDKRTIIIGGGFYGLRIAQYLYDELGQKDILVIEKEDEVMMRASYNNQARVHGGYHYPRSVLTALRSKVNAPIFTKEYNSAIVDNFTKYYGVATNFSKVSANQFQRFYERIGAKIELSNEAMKYFDSRLIENVFRVEEHVFNSAVIRRELLKNLSKRNITIKTQEKVLQIINENDSLRVITDRGEYISGYVLNTTYSSINEVNKQSNLPVAPLKHELTEMCLVEVPEELEDSSFTIMCGPFFSLVPFPDKNAFTLSHVRYTPHSEWYDSDSEIRKPHEYLDHIKKISHFPQMIADVKRFMPDIGKKIRYTGESLWEIKTVLSQSEEDDSRPILYKEHYGGLRNYICIMGGKIDNIYDVFRELKVTYGETV